MKHSGGMISEENLSTFLRKVDDVKAALELEKSRIDSFVVGEFFSLSCRDMCAGFDTFCLR